MTSSSFGRGLGSGEKTAKLCTASEIACDSSYHVPKAGNSLATRSGHLRRRRAVAGDVISEPPQLAPSCDSNVTLSTNAQFFSAALLSSLRLFILPSPLSVLPLLLILAISLGSFCHVEARGRSWRGTYFVEGVVDVVSQGRSLSDAYYDLV
jgi:hypothetical protein